MKRIFRWSAIFFAVSFVGCTLAFSFVVGTGEETALNNLALGGTTFFLFLMIPLFLSTLISGGALTFQRWRGGNRAEDKAKRKYNTSLYDLSENERLDRIMARLSLEEREYLEDLLVAREMGLTDDGELTSLDDVLEQFERR
jgi:hypothetical protein